MMFTLRMTALVLAAALALAAFLPAPAFGQGANATIGDNNVCDAPPVSESKAKNIARQHFMDLGYTPPFGSNKTYRLGSALCEDGIWRIRVRVGDASEVPNRTVFMLVNCHTGELTTEAT